MGGTAADFSDGKPDVALPAQRVEIDSRSKNRFTVVIHASAIGATFKRDCRLNICKIWAEENQF